MAIEEMAVNRSGND